MISDERLSVIRRDMVDRGLFCEYREFEKEFLELRVVAEALYDRMEYEHHVRWPWSCSCEWSVLWASFIVPGADDWLRSRLEPLDFWEPIHAKLWMALNRSSDKRKARSLAFWFDCQRSYTVRCAAANWLDSCPPLGWAADESWKTDATSLRDLRIRRAESYIACSAMYRASLVTESGDGLDRFEGLVSEYRKLESSKWD